AADLDAGAAAYLAADIAVESAAAGVRKAARTRRAAGRALAQLLRELVQPFPTRPALDPEWLAWPCRTGARPAPAPHAEPPGRPGAAARLAVLADALEEAGCGKPAILGHLRSPGPHVRGCWVVDALLGKT